MSLDKQQFHDTVEETRDKLEDKSEDEIINRLVGALENETTFTILGAKALACAYELDGTVHCSGCDRDVVASHYVDDIDICEWCADETGYYEP